ncbi:MAG: 23S rRNA (adenine(2503)-C(2))-methyltransferase [candidate division Zixibacteria bacterium RBG_16_43_9]|nr:MAG: 23S rRNA (adenine(2503)-C(2))-methyltransferase [candidate division Zixibacteria bacterium RBG_16_43_9]
MEKINLKALWIEELESFLDKLGEKKYKAKQLAKWIYNKGVTDFEEMTDLSKDLRRKLSEVAYIGKLKLTRKQVSKIDQTEKFLLELFDDKRIETVLMREKNRVTVCISTQVGCALNCIFCATGKSGFERNLSAGEIVDQIIAVKGYLKEDEKITNIVIMGMGEPLLNYENTVKAIRIIQSELGLSISAKRITLSTSGIAPEIYKLADERLKIKLALSLNAPDDELRRKLMPITKKYPLSEVLEALKYYAKKNDIRITFEYVLIKDVNDSEEQALKLAKLIRGITCKINLIPYNPIKECPYKKPDEETLMKFRDILYPRAPAVTLRRSKGEDIQAACGQLKAGM